jgi:hypothetical protein
VVFRDEGAYRVDVASGVVHTVCTAANETDINQGGPPPHRD